MAVPTTPIGARASEALKATRRLAGSGQTLDEVKDLLLNVNHYVLLTHGALAALGERVARLEDQVASIQSRVGQDGSLRDEVVAGRTAEIEALAFVSRSLDELRAELAGADRDRTR